jgi:hypothetical protein
VILPSCCSVEDPHHVDADPVFLIDADPDFHSDADPDPSFQIKNQPLEKSGQIGSYSIHFGLSSEN